MTLVLNLGKGMARDLLATPFVYPQAPQSKILLGDGLLGSLHGPKPVEYGFTHTPDTFDLILLGFGFIG